MIPSSSSTGWKSIWPHIPCGIL